jgi:predicted RNA binding protein YcfA (HicA-like mRNA interferase family)
MAAIRPIPYKKFEKVLKKLGCELARHKGSSHRVWKKPGLKRPLIVPTDNPLPVFIIENNLRVFRSLP